MPVVVSILFPLVEDAAVTLTQQDADHDSAYIRLYLDASERARRMAGLHTSTLVLFLPEESHSFESVFWVEGWFVRAAAVNYKSPARNVAE